MFSLFARRSSPAVAAFSRAFSTEIGTVKWFDASKGFGFITRNNGADVFVHFSSVKASPKTLKRVADGSREIVVLRDGQDVSFTIGDGPKGMCAIDVDVVEKN